MESVLPEEADEVDDREVSAELEPVGEVEGVTVAVGGSSDGVGVEVVDSRGEAVRVECKRPSGLPVPPPDAEEDTLGDKVTVMVAVPVALSLGE